MQLKISLDSSLSCVATQNQVVFFFVSCVATQTQFEFFFEL